MCKIQMGKPDGNDGVIWGPWDCFWQPVLAAAHLCYQSLTHTSCRFKHLNILTFMARYTSMLSKPDA